jgi:hypothetical protein
MRAGRNEMNASYGLIRQIKRLAGSEVLEQSVERSLRLILAHTPIGAVLATVAGAEFTPALLEAAQGSEEEEGLAWLTLAAAGPVRARRALGSRAVDLVDPEQLVAAMNEHGRLREACERRAEEAAGDELWGAWLLLSRLRHRELRRLVEARPALRALYREARRPAREINPRIADQLAALGLV